MSKTLSLYQKVLIIKWYYKHDEKLHAVEELFKESFHFSPISTAFDDVVKAFELSGSVADVVLCDIKGEPAEESENEIVYYIDIEEDESNDVPIKEELSAEETPAIKNAATGDTTASHNPTETLTKVRIDVTVVSILKVISFGRISIKYTLFFTNFRTMCLSKNVPINVIFVGSHSNANIT